MGVRFAQRFLRDHQYPAYGSKTDRSPQSGYPRAHDQKIRICN
jgi:hypothetical protein